jgi:hypothetical protein
MNYTPILKLSGLQTVINGQVPDRSLKTDRGRQPNRHQISEDPS